MNALKEYAFIQVGESRKNVGQGSRLWITEKVITKRKQIDEISCKGNLRWMLEIKEAGKRILFSVKAGHAHSDWSKFKLKPVSEEGVGGHLWSLLPGRFMTQSGSWRTELTGTCQNHLREVLFLSIISKYCCCCITLMWHLLSVTDSNSMIALRKACSWRTILLWFKESKEGSCFKFHKYL